MHWSNPCETKYRAREYERKNLMEHVSQHPRAHPYRFLRAGEVLAHSLKMRLVFDLVVPQPHQQSLDVVLPNPDFQTSGML